jgi:ABC-type transport system involved in cytochrome c biogenesis permease component
VAQPGDPLHHAVPGALIVLVFAFAFISGADVNPAPGVVAGILWVSVLFSGTVALGRTFDRERENEAIRSLLLSPVPRPAIYLGKLVATSVLMGLVQVVGGASVRPAVQRRARAGRRCSWC